MTSRTVKVGGTTARQYELAFTKNGERLVEQITFVLRGRREYELLCRYKAGKDEPGLRAAPGLLPAGVAAAGRVCGRCSWPGVSSLL